MSGRQDLVFGFNWLVRIHSADLSSSGKDQSGVYLDAQHPTTAQCQQQRPAECPRSSSSWRCDPLAERLQSRYDDIVSVLASSGRQVGALLALCYEAN